MSTAVIFSQIRDTVVSLQALGLEREIESIKVKTWYLKKMVVHFCILGHWIKKEKPVSRDNVSHLTLVFQHAVM